MDKPFVFWYGSIEPHRPYTRGAGQRAGIDLNAIPLPPYWPDSPQVRADVADYLQEAQTFDAQLGEILRSLEKIGELDNTVIFVLSDNGMPFPRCKASLYDFGTRIPLFVRFPARIKAGRTVDDLVSYIDLAPTILEIAGLDPHPQMTGKSFLPLLTSPRSGYLDASRAEVCFGTEGFARERLWPTRGIRTREYLYIRNFMPEKWRVLSTLQGGPTKAYMDAYKTDPEVARLAQLAFGKRPAEELYDLTKDPFSLTNVIDDPVYTKIHLDLATRLLQRLERTDDPRLDGEQPGY